VVVAVTCDLVSVRRDLRNDLRVHARVGGEHEERRSMTTLGKCAADLERVPLIWAVVERERERARLRPDLAGSGELCLKSVERHITFGYARKRLFLVRVGSESAFAGFVWGVAQHIGT
jgi:hypothetical protein